MRLTRLTLSGFKSFAKSTTFEFPAAISAIVGPNGSGKSNVAEAIRWVLGEQSLKTLRGKRGEDLIFNGSTHSPRRGKASVTLIFDNRDHKIEMDFSEVALERKIYRDGTNEYFLNDSRVRLKDIVELLARMGLGETKHNIIGQGEVDRLLLATPRDRRELLEEAIGLRLYQLRKREAERKLEETRENMGQAELLAKEIRPHLKFLKSQADKAGERETIREDLGRHLRTHLRAEEATANVEEKRIRQEQTPKARGLAKIEKEINELAGSVGNASKGTPVPKTREETETLEDLERKRRELLRELGKIEAHLEDHADTRERERPRLIDAARVMTQLEELKSAAQIARGLDGIAEIKERLVILIATVERFLGELKSAPTQESHPAGERERLEGERARAQKDLTAFDQEIENLRGELSSEIARARHAETEFQERFRRLRHLEEEANHLRLALERLEFDMEKLKLKRDELARLGPEYGFNREDLGKRDAERIELAGPELRRKIDRLKARYDEIGGIDPVVLKEYEDTKSRSDFLERELGDLEKAADDLGKLVDELDERIEHDFEVGFSKIQKTFHEYFQTIFGGGKGMLEYFKMKSRKSKDADEVDEIEPAEDEYGIDIKVDIPRKRIKSLDMLSGGERALTSIALLFAITAVNPPPFLILDETDAALDEANSTKYGEILKQLAKETQLVIITHNRETMKQAGILYGVTMGEDDVSKVLSLKLEEAKDYGNR